MTVVASVAVVAAMAMFALVAAFVPAPAPRLAAPSVLQHFDFLLQFLELRGVLEYVLLASERFLLDREERVFVGFGEDLVGGVCCAFFA